MDEEPELFAPPTLLVALGATVLCLLGALCVLRGWGVFRKLGSVEGRKPCGCACSCGSEGGGRGEMEAARANGGVSGRDKAVVERQAVASMMEMLVPEITTHTLSYLDCPSLCRLSMTNSSMRRAANDDGPWKALYRKDFTVEQDNITPANGWKSYYASTKAVVNVNAEFYNIIRERSLPAMSHFWLQADYVKCIHGTGDLYSGYHAVVQSWALAFHWGEAGGPGELGVGLQIRDVRARVLSGMAWVTMKAYVGMDVGPFHVTNIFEFHNGRWYMVHHHTSVMVIDGDPGQQNLIG